MSLVRSIFLPLGLVLLCGSCRPRTASHADSCKGDADTIPLRYARHLTMVEHPGFTEALIRDPEDSTRILQRIELHRPLHRLIVSSSIHCALLQELGCDTTIAGVCDAQYNRLPYVLEGLENGTITNIGNSMEPNMERVVDLRPDAFLSASLEQSGVAARLEQFGIPLIPCADYMESSPLARAEWIRFYGRMTGQGNRADSLFQQIEQRYLALKEKTQEVTHRPRLVCEMPYNGTWYVPRGESYAAHLYRDAGADYVFGHLAGTGSAALSTETALDKALTAEVWLVRSFGPLTRSRLYQDSPNLQQIRAKLWVCDTSEKLYFEQTTFHPDEALSELIRILHPQIAIEGSDTYFSLTEE